jgi:signal transduction histidine kinase/ActR/RegA family two-component response regulator
MYRLSLYPNDDLFQVYSTHNPRLATFGVVAIVLAMSLVFFLYDFCVRREFHEKEDLLQAKRNFMRWVSHEVRTPLNSVCMGLDVVQKEIATSMGYASVRQMKEASVRENSHSEVTLLRSDTAEWVELTSDVLANAQNAVEVLSDLLNFDKIEAGTLSLELDEVPIWRLIEKTVQTFGLVADTKNIDMRLQFGNNLSKVSQLSDDTRERIVLGDAVRIVQVLRNLISNALKFTPQSGTVTIWATIVEPKNPQSKPQSFDLSNGSQVSLREAGELELTVVDSGAGMSEEQLERLFRDGVQFNSNQLQGGGGSGLGLFISKGIVQQHGGSVWATSGGLGHGTSFHVKLSLHRPIESLSKAWNQDRPLTDSETISSPSIISTPNIPSRIEAVAKRKSYRLLVADDSMSNRKLLCRLLQREGHVCVQAEHGQAAVDLYQQAKSPFDCILLDYEMPVLNGPGAAIALRKLGCETLIIAITGNALAEDIRHFLKCGAKAVLTKPFQMAKLQEVWDEHLEGPDV